MVRRDLGHGFFAVPWEAVTLNGMELPQLNTMVEPYVGAWHVIAPNGRAIDNENNRPYRYSTIEEAIADVANLIQQEDYSTCGGVVKNEVRQVESLPVEAKSEGDACPFDRCIGVLRFEKVQDCSCHIAPPCSQCVDNPLRCSECGWSPGDPEEPPVVIETASQLALDVSLETARALHRVWRALNDGDCPKCHHAVAATDVIRPNLKDGVWLKCPNPDCGFHVLGEEITEIERMFAPAMDAAVSIFEQWRESRR